MILSNTTFVTETSHAEALEQWLADVYTPALEQSGLFTGILAMRILGQAEPGTVSYAVQKQCVSPAALRDWESAEGDCLLSLLTQRFGEQGVLHFTTHMRIL